MKKLIALILTALVILAMPAANAFAAGKDMDTASRIESGKTYSGNTESPRWYKIDTEKGTLKISFQFTCINYSTQVVGIYNKDGEAVYPDDMNASVGRLSSISSDFRGIKDSATDIFKGTASYTVKKGTYYVKVSHENFANLSNYKLKVTTPGTDSSSSAKLTALSTTLKAGETLTFAPVTSASGAKVAWSSSDKSVATVSGGKITAVKAGTADITCKCGSTSMTIRVKVS